MSVNDHRHRVSHEENIDVGAGEQTGERTVVASRHCQPLANCLFRKKLKNRHGETIPFDACQLTTFDIRTLSTMRQLEANGHSLGSATPRSPGPPPATRGKPCPIKRVNAQTLQEAVLAEIARCGEHPTRLATFIREAAKAMPSTDESREEIKRLERNKREAEKKFHANQMALEVGSTSGTVLTTLVKRIAELEAHITEIEGKRKDLMGQIESFRHRRPEADQVAGQWQHVLEIWEFLSGEERTELIGLLVEEVTMVEKEKAAVRLNLTSGLLQVRNFEPNGCGGKTRTYDLWVMSPTSYQLLHPAMTKSNIPPSEWNVKRL